MLPPPPSPSSSADAATFERSWQSQIDLVVTIGGDGTMLHAAGLFPAAPPPICSFFSGNAHFPIGFLSPHPPREFERVRRARAKTKFKIVQFVIRAWHRFKKLRFYFCVQ
jgi:NAD kinase